MSITTRNFARITKKKNLMKGWTKLLASKGHWVLTLRPLSEKAKCCSSFLSAACSLPGNLPEEASTTLQSVRAWLGLSGPPTCLYSQVCVSWPRPPRPNQSQHVLSLYFTQRGMHVKGNTYTVKKKITTVILNKKTCYTERCIYSIQYSINVME